MKTVKDIDNELRLKKKNILVTGLPGVGKTTLIKNLCLDLGGLHPAGFYTEEVREKGVRKGFELVSLNGERAQLSHKNTQSAYRVGNYRVDVAGFEQFLSSIQFFEPKTDLIIVDEIGKMECLSGEFKTLCAELLDSKKLVIATISLAKGGFIGGIKKRQDVEIVTVTKDNRDYLLSKILDKIIVPLKQRDSSICYGKN